MLLTHKNFKVYQNIKFSDAEAYSEDLLKNNIKKLISV